MIEGLTMDQVSRNNAEERGWLPAGFTAVLSRFILLAGLAIMLGVSAGVLVERYGATPVVEAAE